MSCLHPFPLLVETEREGVYKEFQIPCGKCSACLSRKQSEWIFRLQLEKMVSYSSFFVTLTYSDANLPLKGVQKKDCQDFIKRFRKRYCDGFDGLKLKYFLVSEYGSLSSRPHYHLILFFNQFLDVRVICNWIYSCWKKGEIKIGSVDIASITYVTKYCLKDRYDESGFFKEKTFTMMSKRPAIGIDYLFNSEVVRLHQETAKFKVISPDGYIVNLPRYYRERLFDDFDKWLHREELQEIFAKQKTRERSPIESYIYTQEQERKRKIKNKQTDKL